MNIASVTGLLIASLVAVVPAQAVEDRSIERLATCQDSWFEMKDDAVRIKTFAESFQAAFVRKDDDAFFVPKTKVIVAGLPVSKAFPDSVGMGVGFSVIVDASFDKTRAAVEKTIGESLKMCETSDNMRTCALEIGEKKTITLMAEDSAKSASTLVGCYYYYAK